MQSFTPVYGHPKQGCRNILTYTGRNLKASLSQNAIACLHLFEWYQSTAFDTLSVPGDFNHVILVMASTFFSPHLQLGGMGRVPFLLLSRDLVMMDWQEVSIFSYMSSVWH